MSTLPKSLPRYQASRRRFLRTVGLFVGVVGASLATLLPVIAKWVPARLRPPGAIEEPAFLASCIKCGQCVQVCPVQAIRLADIDEAMGVGVPYIDARAQACDFSCDAVQCILACPTGSLNHTIIKKEEVRMGLARVARPEACLASQGQGFQGQARGADFQGLLRYTEIDRWNPIPVRDHPYDLELCDLCVRQCPIETAISLQHIDNEGKRKMPVINKACVGCGVCEMICPVEPTVIVIDERKMWGAA
ncbi:nitrate reductase, ferredoxin-type protein [Candidatus Thiomargarita nelsonii]|uniref:Nitrate reductase, ferredoxin-type protein n=1 Tax=Candidatus Thiomargarita nelsonii TaxID=1003181 RepID=A0A176RVZ8_9GAMM|nr:nitrate reductase, ferredoxin-type protein [Candidatus Thiomargarita nelsonii]